MTLYRKVFGVSLALGALVSLGGCAMGPAAVGSFDRDFTVSGPLRLELANAAGDVSITGSTDGKVHVHGEVKASGMGFEEPKKRLDDTLASPPVEQRGDTIRIGKELSHVRQVAISYSIQVPHDTEVDSTMASGTQTIRNLRGPVTVKAMSGSIHVEKIDRDAQLTTMSGSISANDIGSDVHVSTTSGSVAVSNVKGNVRVGARAAVIRVSEPGGRVEANTTSGGVEIRGAGNDVTAHAVAGRVFVQGNPGQDSFWDLKTGSGTVQFTVPATANFHLSAEAVSGAIRADIPIVIEEQGKHSLRAHMGNGGGRVEVHTVSGEIRVTGGK